MHLLPMRELGLQKWSLIHFKYYIFSGVWKKTFWVLSFIPDLVFKVVKIRGKGKTALQKFTQKTFQRLRMPCAKKQRDLTGYCKAKSFEAFGCPAEVEVFRV